jgi:hypothetical protein
VCVTLRLSHESLACSHSRLSLIYAQVPDDGVPSTYQPDTTQSWDMLTPHQLMSLDTEFAVAVTAGDTQTLVATRRGIFAIGYNQQGKRVT